jgi:hypothetical protein
MVLGRPCGQALCREQAVRTVIARPQAVAIHVFEQPPMDRFVPRDDAVGAMTPWG